VARRLNRFCDNPLTPRRDFRRLGYKMKGFVRSQDYAGHGYQSWRSSCSIFLNSLGNIWFKPTLSQAYGSKFGWRKFPPPPATKIGFFILCAGAGLFRAFKEHIEWVKCAIPCPWHQSNYYYFSWSKSSAAVICISADRFISSPAQIMFQAPAS